MNGLFAKHRAWVIGIAFGIVLLTIAIYFASRNGGKPDASGPATVEKNAPASKPAGHVVSPAPEFVVAFGTPPVPGDEIEPANEARVRGTEVFVRWRAPAKAEGRVRWRPAGGNGEFAVTPAAAAEMADDPLVARLTGLKPGTYEYVVEHMAGGLAQRSAPRKLIVEAGPAVNFAPAAVEATFRRDYDQIVTVGVKNDTPDKVWIAARAAAQFPDLPADIVGPGSVDEPVELAPGAALNLSLAVTAPDARRAAYEIPIEAAGAFGVARIRIVNPKLQLSIKVVEEDPRTLAKTVEIHNDGDATLADLAVRAAPPNDPEVRLEPSVSHAYLASRQTLRVIIAPVLYLEFQSLKLDLLCQAAGQEVRFPLEFRAPAGKRLMAVRTGTQYRNQNANWYCTNKPVTCSDLPGGPGNGPLLASMGPLFLPSPGSCATCPDCDECTAAAVCRKVSQSLEDNRSKFCGSAALNSGACSNPNQWTICKLVKAAESKLQEYEALQDTYSKLIEKANANGNYTMADAEKDKMKIFAEKLAKYGRKVVQGGDDDKNTSATAQVTHYSGKPDKPGEPGKKWSIDAANEIDVRSMNDDPRKQWDAHFCIEITADYLRRASPIELDVTLEHELTHIKRFEKEWDDFKKSPNPGNGDWEKWKKILPPTLDSKGQDIVPFLKEERDRYEEGIDKLTKWLEKCKKCCPGGRSLGPTENRRMAGASDDPPVTIALDSAAAPEGFAEIIAGDDAVGLDAPEPQMRPGLLQALERRAMFTRTHRGPLPSPSQRRNDLDSSDQPAGWHTGQRVFFAWNDAARQVWLASCDARGATPSEVWALGIGYWPRLAVDGERVAVLWRAEGGEVVRVYDGRKWGDALPFDKGDGVIAFAPGGPLHAATSAGLWKLTDRAFERVQPASWGKEIALVFDAQGKPHVASKKELDHKIVCDGQVVCDDAALVEGQPSLAAAPDGTLYISYLSFDNSVVVRSRKGDSWSAPRVVHPKGVIWPTLALDAEGQPRLSLIGPTPPGPEALHLVRLTGPDAEPILMPSLAGNVLETWLILHFGLRGSRWNYRPHDVSVSFNDFVIRKFENTIPEGRYLFRLPPSLVFTSPGAPVFNRVGIRSRHMNGGHYATNSDYQLITRTAWSEFYCFAADVQEARLAAARPGTNHNQPDLAVLANSLQVPARRPESGKLEFHVVVANLGEAESLPAGLFALAGDAPLAHAKVPRLKPGDQWTTTMRLDGKLPGVTFLLKQGAPDFDPANDSLTLSLWTPEETSAAAPTVTVAPPTKAFVTVENAAGERIPFSVTARKGNAPDPAEDGRRGLLLADGEYTVKAGPFEVPVRVKAPPADRKRPPLNLDALSQQYAWLADVKINTNNANLMLRETDGNFRRWYNSRSMYDGPFGFGWTFDYGARLGRTPEGAYTVMEADGFQSTYREAGQYHEMVAAPFSSLLMEENGRVVRHCDADEYHRVYGGRVARETFGPDGRLLLVRFAGGVEHELRYEPDSGPKPGALKAVVDKQSGKTIYAFETSPDGKFAAVTNPDGSVFRFTYSGKMLTGVQEADAAASSTTYRYSADYNLLSVKRRNGSAADFAYDEQKDWLTSMRAGGLEYDFKYGEDSPTRLWTIRTDADGNLTRWDFDEPARASLRTNIEFLDGRIELLGAQTRGGESD